MVPHYWAYSLAPPGATPEELRRRQSRWRFFQIVFTLTYAGIVLDVVTTAIGFQKSGSSYEQNPLGGLLITHVGWMGILAVLTAFSLVAYVSGRTIAWRMRMRWIAILNAIVVLLMAVRWLAVVTAVIYIMSPS
jgi:hypothetical protein